MPDRASSRPLSPRPRTASRRKGARAAARRPATAREQGAFPIVGLGASAGGLEALSELLGALTPGIGFGYVVVQHLDPLHESALTQLLSRATRLPVREAEEGLLVAADHVYVIPPNVRLGIEGGALKLLPRESRAGAARGVDDFFEALAADRRERAIGVVLSGTGSDGTLGLEAIKAEGGITFAQDDSARYDSMPSSAVAAGCVDFVLSPAKIAAELGRIARHPLVAGSASLPSGARARAREPEAPQPESDGYQKIVLLLRHQSGVDFSLYKQNTLRRRIARRMVLGHHESIDNYAKLLRDDAEELDALYADSLIGVTGFFRNPEAFELLQRAVLPRMSAERVDEPARVWVLGCSTGQEAYSIAMAYAEVAENDPDARPLQVFATDLSEANLKRARHGQYTQAAVQGVSPERLERFFVAEVGGYRVTKPLREKVVFARQNLLVDPPFSRMDLVSCRNVLIYLEPSLQQRLVPKFHFALKPGGCLLLGASESVGGFARLFEPLDRKLRLFTRKPGPSLPLQLTAHGASGPQIQGASTGLRQPSRNGGAAQGSSLKAESGELEARREADRVTVNRLAPPAVLVDSQLRILQFRGATGAFLGPRTGRASLDLLKMARPGLVPALRAALQRAKRDGEVVRTENVRVESDGDALVLRLEVVPLKNLREHCFLVLFEAAAPAALAAPPTKRGRGTAASARRRPRKEGSEPTVEALEAELAETRDYLQSVQEQHEAAQEELQSSAEEVQSANEELQSINEELETSKEELESANEELTTVNEEMAHRNADLLRLNNDLINVEASSHLPIVLVGRDLAIRRFSSEAERELGLLAADVGRRLGIVRLELDLPDVDALVAEVMESVQPVEREVRRHDGRWVSVRVRPYLTVDRKVDGAVLVVVDIDELKRGQQALAAARDEAEAILRTIRDPLLILDTDLLVERANRSFFETFQVVPAEAVGRPLLDLGNGQFRNPRLLARLDEVRAGAGAFDNFEVEAEFESIGLRSLVLDARTLRDKGDGRHRILLGIRDVTEIRRSQEQLEASERRFTTFMENLPGLAWIKDAEGRYVFVNEAAELAFGRPRDEIRGRTDAEMFPPETAARFHENDLRVLDAGSSLVTIEELIHPDGEVHHSVVHKFILPTGDGDRLLAGVAMDVTALKRAEEALRDLNRRKSEFLAMLAHELRNPLAPICTSLELLRWELAEELAQRDGSAAEASGGRGKLLPVVEMMTRQVRHLLRLVDDLLDVQRIDRGTLELRLQRVDLVAIVREVLADLEPTRARRRHGLEVSLPEGPVHLEGDEARLVQIASNLLNNAYKFTGEGGRIEVEIKVDRTGAFVTDGAAATPEVAPPGAVVLRIRDDGIGLASEEIPRIFGLFAQAGRSTENSGGLGIGLALVRYLVDLHGGTVAARSAGVGKGSEFEVRLPLAAAVAPAVAPAASWDASAAPTKGLRILVVDDNRDAANSLAALLRLAGHRIATVYDGLEAVATAVAQRPDVVLLDLGLPGIDGLEAARRIRERMADGSPLLVAVSGRGEPEDRLRSTAAGFDAHFVKPVDHEALTSLIGRLARA